MRHKIATCFGLILILAGIVAFLYPDISNLFQEVQSEELISEFEEYYDVSDEIEEEDASEETGTSEEADSSGSYTELHQAILEYNQEIYESNQAEFKDAWVYTQSPIDIDYLENELFGYIEIPAMDVKLPLYIGASTANLAKGAAIMGQTSIPIGGVNTNSVIAGHRGYRGSPFFREIEKLQLGDYVYITNPWGTLVYQAVEIKIIDPYDSEAVKIQEGRDLITLLTCHPYMSGGKYRYLVFCERVESDSANADSLPDNYVEINANNEILYDSYVIETSQDIIDLEKLVRRGGATIITAILLFVVIRKAIDKHRTHYRFP